MGVWAQSGGTHSGYDYVQTEQPENAEEGETWYDIDGDAAFVFDGAEWLEMTVTDHAQLADVVAGQHRSDSNIRTTVDGQVDAETVDGQHASDLSDHVETIVDSTGGGGELLWTFEDEFDSTPAVVATSIVQSNNEDYPVFVTIRSISTTEVRLMTLDESGDTVTDGGVYAIAREA